MSEDYSCGQNDDLLVYQIMAKRLILFFPIFFFYLHVSQSSIVYFVKKLMINLLAAFRQRPTHSLMNALWLLLSILSRLLVFLPPFATFAWQFSLYGSVPCLRKTRTLSSHIEDIFECSEMCMKVHQSVLCHTLQEVVRSLRQHAHNTCFNLSLFVY